MVVRKQHVEHRRRGDEPVLGVGDQQRVAVGVRSYRQGAFLRVLTRLQPVLKSGGLATMVKL